MLKDKILQTINNNEVYQKARQTFNNTEEFEITTCSALEIEDTIEILDMAVDEFLSFKDRVLEVIKNNVYFQCLIEYQTIGTSDIIETATFVSIDNKVILSADGKIIVPAS